MKILLLGRNGQVGWELQRQLPVLGEVVALGSSTENGLCGDLRDVDGLRATVRAVAPDVIVNAAAYTAVDKAESEPEEAMAVNGIAPGVLAEEAKRLDALLVHYSTDYVFDGSGSVPWKETDPTGPLNVYGHTKLAGEQAIQAAWEKHLIFRTSWVFGVHGNNFIKTMLRLAQERDSLNVVNDQVGSPTSAGFIASATVTSLRQASGRSQHAGLYHLASAGQTSWYGYAAYVLERARQMGWPVRVMPEAICGIPSSEYPVPARRPGNSRLDTRRLMQAFGIQPPSWQDSASAVMEQLESPATR